MNDSYKGDVTSRASKEQFSYGHCIACPLIYSSNEQRYIHHATPRIQRLAHFNNAT